MSETGHLRRLGDVRGWSALPPIFAVKADIADGQLGHNRISGIAPDCEICFREPNRTDVGSRASAVGRHR
jgi:hypothetical protein